MDAFGAGAAPAAPRRSEGGPRRITMSVSARPGAFGAAGARPAAVVPVAVRAELWPFPPSAVACLGSFLKK